MAKADLRQKAKELFLSGLTLSDIQLKLKGEVSGASLRRWASEGGWREQLVTGARQDTCVVLTDPNVRKMLDTKGQYLIGEVTKRVDKLLDVVETISFQQNLCKGVLAECGIALNELRAHRDNGGKAIDNLPELSRISSIIEKSVATWRLVVGLATQKVEIDLSQLHPEILESVINGETDP